MEARPAAPDDSPEAGMCPAVLAVSRPNRKLGKAVKVDGKRASR